MSTSKPVPPSKISKREFAGFLDKYSNLIESTSAAKGAKDGQKTLAELDHYRYIEAPGSFSLIDEKHPMTIAELKLLVEWKLRHGKFRPTLMKLVSSNEPASVISTIQKALSTYQEDGSVSAALAALSKLKGVGPATASLLLAVHFPEKVIFFSDEAYYWLCNNGRKDSLKYTMKEYENLNLEAQKLMSRLDVTAVAVEKVAYVCMRLGELTLTHASKNMERSQEKAVSVKATKNPTEKRKRPVDDAQEDMGPVKRSTRRGTGL